MGLDYELAIAFIYNTAKQDTTNEHPHVILRVNINKMPTADPALPHTDFPEKEIQGT